MLKNITLIKTKYKHINSKINEVTSFKTTIKATLGAVLLSILIMIIPALLVYNFYVFPKLHILLKIIMIIIVWSFSFLYNYIYDSLLKNYHEQLIVLKTKTLIVVDSIIAGVVLSAFMLIIMQFI